MTVLFAVGAVVLVFGRDEEPDDTEVPAGSEGNGPVGLWRVLATSFGVVFLGEWGDITQLTTANLSARYADPLSVGLGAGLALCAVSGLAVTVGRNVLRWLPVPLVRRIAGSILAVLGVGAYRVGFARPKATLGEQPERIGDTRVCVLPNPSGLNANYQKADLARLFRTLREAAESPGAADDA